MFLYAPAIDGDNNCLYLDDSLQKIASILRTLTDIFYLLRIIFQFRTGFAAPSPGVFGRGVLVDDAFAIAKRYLTAYFLVDFLAVLPLPQVLGALWYILAIQREDTCWREACNSQDGCELASLYCGSSAFRNNSFLQDACPTNGGADVDPIYGIYLPVLQNVSQSTGFFEKLFYCFWWGLQSLCSYGQNLKTSTYIWENLFAVFVSTSGLVLFALLIGNVQVQF
ncbi:hypothetical protein U9M48_024881 [Paspalum notatum var. saurae]|uniref:Ion transport domain-containing protein n=1 Tax=Paspalum notatum var. saurae TaxID=547442 RepID=A0AAQ3TN76_PASNO